MLRLNESGELEVRVEVSDEDGRITRHTEFYMAAELKAVLDEAGMVMVPREPTDAELLLDKNGDLLRRNMDGWELEYTAAELKAAGVPAETQQKDAAALYQVVGCMLSDTGQFETDHGEKVLDLLSWMGGNRPERPFDDAIETLLPWPSANGVTVSVEDARLAKLRRAVEVVAQQLHGDALPDPYDERDTCPNWLCTRMMKARDDLRTAIEQAGGEG